MFGFLRRKKTPAEPEYNAPLPSASESGTVDGASAATLLPPPNESARVVTAPLVEPAAHAVQEKPKSRFWQQLSRSRNNLTEGLGNLFLGKKTLDAEILEELETRLILADVGQATTRALIKELEQQISRKQIHDPEALFEKLRELMITRLAAVQRPVSPRVHHPHVILMCGINGAGKTTTIGKLAHWFRQSGQTVMLAAGDTFRAAAVEQLMTWGARNQIPVIGEPGRGDAASVLFDAVQAARARGMEVLIADTAGRLHTQGGLMDELKKLTRVLDKAEPGAPHEVLLVLDASIGQNALNQARQFHQAVGVTGLIVTKLDGTAKGGIIFAIADELALPIEFIGIGEALDDLRPFDPTAYVDTLLDRESA
ncbi:signal recognition particle-docking protein FtsY [Halothiobacillus sp. DCM-1]|uniref:signal recognition particle-docking protein FtsY n=1 Tax=Halothiobacillus sp. DCM-1 TaxID=3112558 RepID=UPI00324D7D17